ncbi:hypothetical protein QBC40DRAFT_269884 [Triangularia verruculosa]|uniref:Uncharacterized protein n=1 Tax=Triangularia verruculosa TaxID=2587418 RepID=A0AAN7APM0_9PEZI|nr:hypothetical protein QBC40DRAFT_269884 [Triangularia verruculosa]
MDDDTVAENRSTMTMPFDVPEKFRVAPDSPLPFAEDWAKLLAQADIRCLENPGVSFTHLRGDYSSPDSTISVIKALLDRCGRAKASPGPLLVLPDKVAIECLRPSLPGVTFKTYSELASSLRSGSLGMSPLTVFGTNGGRHPLLLLMSMAWLVRRLAQCCKLNPAQSHASVFVLSPSSQAVWAETPLLRHFDPVQTRPRCWSVETSFQKPQNFTVSHDTDCTAVVLDKLAEELERLHGEADPEPGQVFFGSCVVPLEACLSMQFHVTEYLWDVSNYSVVVVILTAHNLGEWDRVMHLVESAEPHALLLLVDSSLAYIPSIGGRHHFGLLPREVTVRQWDTRIGHVVELPAKLPVAELDRLHALNSRKGSAHSRFIWAGPPTSGNPKPEPCHPWSGHILELLICAIDGLQQGLPGDPDCMWWCLEDMPVFPFDMHTFRRNRRWFQESIRQLCAWGLVKFSPSDPTVVQTTVDVTKQPGLFLSSEWGSPVQALLITGRAVTVYEAMLMVIISREPDRLVKYTLAAVASLYRVGAQTIIRRCYQQLSTSEPTFERCRAACSAAWAGLAARGRLWLALGLVYRAIATDFSAEALLEHASVSVLRSQLDLFRHHMCGKLNIPDPEPDMLSTELNHAQLLPVETALVRAMLPELVVFACDHDANRALHYMKNVKVEPQPLGWADDQVPPPANSFGLTFRLGGDDSGEGTGYTAAMMVAVSDEAVSSGMRGLFNEEDSDAYHNRLRSFYQMGH